MLLGFRRLAADRVVSAALAVDVIAMAFGMPAALFPDLARHLSGATTSDPADSAMILGLLYAAYPAGVVALGLVSGTFTRAQRPGALLIGAAQVWGLTVILAGLSGKPALTLAALTVGGAANLVLSTCRTTITQARTDDEVRGRVQGALTVVRFGGPQAAVLLHGLAGSVLGPRLGIGLGGLLTVTGLTLIQVRAPQLWHYAGQTTIAPRRTGGRS